MYRLAGDITAEEIDGCYILLRDNEDAVTLNESASFIIEHLDMDNNKIAKLICEKYGVGYVEALSDVELFTRELLKNGLVVETDVLQ